VVPDGVYVQLALDSHLDQTGNLIKLDPDYLPQEARLKTVSEWSNGK
jgi:hypothetical protein